MRGKWSDIHVSHQSTCEWFPVSSQDQLPVDADSKRQQVMGHVVGTVPPTWKTWIGCQDPSLHVLYPNHWKTWRSQVEICTLCFSASASWINTYSNFLIWWYFRLFMTKPLVMIVFFSLFQLCLERIKVHRKIYFNIYHILPKQSDETDA